MRRIVWSRRALYEFDDAIAYIAQDSKSAALNVASRLDVAAGGLRQFSTGRRTDRQDVFEKPVARTSHVIGYTIDTKANAVVILRIVHMARESHDID